MQVPALHTPQAHGATTTANGRLDYIDSLRGIASLLVIWLHVGEVFATVSRQGVWTYDAAAAINAGRVGVVLFFAISGFVIPSSLRATAGLGTRGALRAFAIHRFCRLYPAYWFSVLASCVLGWTFTQPIPTGTALANLTMVQTMFGVVDVIGLYWTLRIELVFYVLCAALFAIGVLHRPAWLAAGVLTGLAGYFGGNLLRYATGAGRAGFEWPEQIRQFPLYALFLSFMFWGALFRRWHDGELRLRADWGGAVLVGLPVLIFIMPVAALILSRWRPFPATDHLAHAVGIGLFILGATAFRLRGRIAPWLGAISYSLYLFHPIVFFGMYEVVRRRWGLMGLPVGAHVLIAMACTIAFAALTYYAIERPAIRFGRRIAPGRGPP